MTFLCWGEFTLALRVHTGIPFVFFDANIATAYQVGFTLSRHNPREASAASRYANLMVNQGVNPDDIQIMSG